jgi:hypothetical protein
MLWINLGLSENTGTWFFLVPFILYFFSKFLAIKRQKHMNLMKASSNSWLLLIDMSQRVPLEDFED